MSNMTKNNKNNLLDIMHTKRIVLVAVIIAITGMFVFSNAFVNPLLAQSSKSNDKTDSSKSKDSNSDTKTTINTDTSSSSADKKDYKDFQKCSLLQMVLKVLQQKQKFKTALDKFILQQQHLHQLVPVHQHH